MAPLGGTFTVSYGGNTTAALPVDAPGTMVAAALNALPSIGGAGTAHSGSQGVVVASGELIGAESEEDDADRELVAVGHAPVDGGDDGSDVGVATLVGDLE